MTAEPALSAMARSALGGMMASLRPMRYQDGIVRQAGTPDGSFSAPTVAGQAIYEWSRPRALVTAVLMERADFATMRRTTRGSGRH
jgi:hypothetical protein